MADRVVSEIQQGRTYDIDFINWQDGVTGVAQLTFGTTARKATGIVKVVNRFIKILLTGKGTDPFFPEEGTSFDNLYHMGAEDEDTLGSFIAIQLSDALGQVKKIQADNSFPADENLSHVTLEAVSKVTPDGLSIQIKFRTESGEGVSVIVPNIGG